MYKLYQNKKYVGSFTKKQLQKALNISNRELARVVASGIPYNRRYLIDWDTSRLGDLPLERLKEEWDIVRKQLNPAAVP